jgi:hypothetical protein
MKMTRNQFKAHFKNLFWHKYYVYQEGRKLGLGRVRLLIHDWDKYGPKMFRAYAENFYAPDGSKIHQDETLLFKQTWNRHQKVSKHHWQAHVRHDDDGTVEVMEMDLLDAKEMVADWRGAGRAYNSTQPLTDWYQKTEKNRLLHPETKQYVEHLIGYRPKPE